MIQIFKKKKDPILESTQKWMPIESIKDGIVKLKHEQYLKIIEVTPVNFKLKSKSEQKAILYEYKSFLKGCPFDMQIVVQSRRTDVSIHTKKIEEYYEKENNLKVREMMNDYISLVKTMSVKKKSISRRFFIVISYSPPAQASIKNVSYEEIYQDLTDKVLKVKQYLVKCQNQIIEYDDNTIDNSKLEDSEIINILYTYLNKNNSVIQNLDNRPLEYASYVSPCVEG